MADEPTRSKSRSRRPAPPPDADETLGAGAATAVADEPEPVEGEPLPGVVPAMQGIARARLGRLRHRSGCPADGREPNEEFTDADGVQRAARIEFLRTVAVEEVEPDPTLRHGHETIVVRCIECGEQEPPSPT